MHKNLKLSKKRGFSLIELVVIIAIVAILIAVLAPSLLTYTERSRAQKDVTTMDEVVNAVQLAMADQHCFDEMELYSCDNNFITYTDSSGKYGQKVVDAEYWAPDGCGRATTITFNPEKDSNGNTVYRLENAIVNDMTFGNGSVATERPMQGNQINDNQCYLKNAKLSPNHESGYLYNKIKSTIGSSVITTSSTYSNSSYTIFIKFSQKDSVTVADVDGAFNGTNLDSSSTASIGSNTTEYVDNDTSKPIESTPEGGKTEVNITSSALQGSGSMVPDYKTPSPLQPSDPEPEPEPEVEKEFIPMQNGQEYIVLDGTEQMSFVLMDDDSINIMYEGAVAANIPSVCVTKTYPTMHVSNTGTEYDGEYEFCVDGYVEMNGQIVAKAKDKWLNIGPNAYVIVHKSDVYASEDGNHLYSMDMSLDTISMGVNLLFSYVDDPNDGLTQETLDAYGYPFTRVEDKVLLTHVFDALAAENLNGTSPWYWIVVNKYHYWGGNAYDREENNSFITQADWNSGVTCTETLSVYKLSNNKTVRVLSTDPITDGTYIFDQQSQYYYNGVTTDNIFVIDDYPFSYADGMTYREWMDSEYVSFALLNDYGALPEYVAYVPRENWDKPCGSVWAGYGIELTFIDRAIDPLIPTGSGCYVGPCEGDVYFQHPSEDYPEYNYFTQNSEQYEYKGLWYGYQQPVIARGQAAKTYEIFAHFIDDYCLGSSIRMQTAYQKKDNANVIDISDYLTSQSYTSSAHALNKSIYLDMDRLYSDFGITSHNLQVTAVIKDGQNIITFPGSWSWNSSGNHVRVNATGLPNIKNAEVGIVFNINGTHYEGFIN